MILIGPSSARYSNAPSLILAQLHLYLSFVLHILTGRETHLHKIKMPLKANQVPGFGDLTNVSAEKLQELETVLQHVLDLPIARDTYAQIIDGTPTRTPFSDEIKRTRSTFYKTIIDSDNSKPTDEAMQKYEEIRQQIAPQDLVIDLKVCNTFLIISHLARINSTQVAQNYQDAPPGSRENHLRLLETAAASVHALAGMTYMSNHEDMDVKPPEPPGGHFRQFHTTDGFYVNFYHTDYKRFERFPFGLLNVVGYWAEAELFGGVVLFERGEGGSGVRFSRWFLAKTYTNGHQITNAFIHPQRESSAFQLSERQLQDFADLSRASDVDGSVGADTLLPFSKELNARVEPTFVHVGEGPLRIYKNEYDKPPVMLTPKRPSCVITEDDPRGASMKEVMKFIKEIDRDKPTGTPSRPFQSQPSLWSAYPTPEEASSSSSSSKDDPSPANKEHK